MIFGRQLVAGPYGGGSGHGVEIFEIDQAGGGFVVVAPHENTSQTAGALNHFVRAGAVADYVAEIGNKVVGRSGGEAGLERFEVGVNVAKQQYAQWAPDKVGIIERVGTEYTEDKEASQTRDCCVAKNATLRAARPDPSQRKSARSG